MKDCSQDVQNFHDDRVTLTAAHQREMRERRDANRDRLHRGLDKKGKPQPDQHIIQGSYAMKTMTQHPDREYDIDDGAAFADHKLKSNGGTPVTPREAKQMVADGLQAGGGLQTDPEIKKNCVRVPYAAGYHVDIPVYRIRRANGEDTRELASDEWRESNATEINDWFADEETKAVDDENEPQLRRLVRLTKVYARVQTGDQALSGLIVTVLAAECHLYSEREDEAFRTLLEKLLQRLRRSGEVRNPANQSEVLTKSSDTCKLNALIRALENSVQAMRTLDRANCRRSEALRVWKDVFKTDYFDTEIEKSKENEKVEAQKAVTAFPHVAKPWCP
jgi:hypothetical protein